MHNLHPSHSTSQQQLLGTHISYVVHRLDALMMVLKSCKGEVCIEPWKVLHPQGDVESLSDALAVRFDAFYEAQTKVAFNRCEAGYIIDAEGPQTASTYRYRQGTRWSDWV